jgi:hypothetical protein
MRTTYSTTWAKTRTFAPADGAAGSATTQTVAEFVTFRLNAGVSDQSFLEAAAQTRTFLNDSGGMIRRSLTKDGDGLWTDYILWASMDIAKSTAEIAMQHPDFAPMMSMIDVGSVELRHDPVLLQMD